MPPNYVSTEHLTDIATSSSSTTTATASNIINNNNSTSCTDNINYYICNNDNESENNIHNANIVSTMNGNLNDTIDNRLPNSQLICDATYCTSEDSYEEIDDNPKNNLYTVSDLQNSHQQHHCQHHHKHNQVLLIITT